MNATFFYKEQKRTQRSFINNIKECKERNILFIKNAKECENARSFERNGCPTLLPAPCSDLWSEGQFENDCQPPVKIFAVEVSLRMNFSPFFRSLRLRSDWEWLASPCSHLWCWGQIENDWHPPVQIFDVEVRSKICSGTQ